MITTEKPTNDDPIFEPTPQPTKEPTNRPSDQATLAPTSLPTEEPIADPTGFPTIEPTDRPTETPTETPTEGPTEAPTEAPLTEPTEAPTYNPTSEDPTASPLSVEPSESPTDNPSTEPSPRPTPKPTVVPTNGPTSAPIRGRCTFDPNESFDYVVIYDDSCNLEDGSINCNNYLNGIGDTIRSIKDNNADSSRVAVVSYTETTSNTLISFDSTLQNDVDALVDNIINRGCSNATNNIENTDLLGAIIDGAALFTDDTRNRKMIAINGCIGDEPMITRFCDEEDENAILVGKDIKVYLVNLIRISGKNNEIKTKTEANNYAQCIALLPPFQSDGLASRNCTGKDSDGVQVGEFDEIIDNCLIPIGICLADDDDDDNDDNNNMLQADKIINFDFLSKLSILPNKSNAFCNAELKSVSSFPLSLHSLCSITNC